MSNLAKCQYCGDTGQIMVGRSGDPADGNCPITEPCEDCDRSADRCEHSYANAIGCPECGEEF